MRLRGQHVPQAPHRAHGQLNCVVSAPVCLFPSRRPQDSLLIRYAVPLRFPGLLFVRAAHLNEVGSGAVSDYNNTASPISSSSGLKIACRVVLGEHPHPIQHPGNVGHRPDQS